MKTCPICNEFLNVSNKTIHDWKVCSHHNVFIKQLQYDQRCNDCINTIKAGSNALLCHHDGRWVVLHLFNRDCFDAREKYRKKQREQYNRRNKAYENNWYNEYKKNERHYNKTNKSGNGSHSGPHSKLYLLNNAPIEVVKAAYRALSLLHHPDHGGDEERMKEINNALDKILKG